MDKDALYPLQPKQLEFATTFAKYRLYGGAKGGGKSYGMRAECTRQALSYPGLRGLVLRRTLPEIEENMITPMRSELPQEIYKYNDQKHLMTFMNGSTIRFSYCANFQDVLNFQGIEYDFICIEELTHWTEIEFRTLMTSLRTVKKGVIPNFFGSTNPGGKGHSWVRRLFVKKKYNPDERPHEYAFIAANVYDNKVLLENQPEYLTSLLVLPEKQRRAYLEGDWDIFDGQYFTEFRESVHIVEPHIPKNAKKYIIALDYGYAKPSCVLWLAQDYDGNVTCYRELYGPGMTYRELAIRALALTTPGEKISNRVADPAIINKRNEATGSSGKEEMAKEGFDIEPAINDRVDGWLVVRKYLQPFVDERTGQTTSRLKITSNCQNLIRTLPEMQHDKKNPEDIDSSLEDHAPDTLRYGLVKFGEPVANFDSVRNMNEAFLKNQKTLSDKSQEFKTPPSRRPESDNKSFLGKKF